MYHRTAPATGDSLYTASGRESENAEKTDGYTAGGDEAFTVSTTARGAAPPVFRLYDPVHERHAWTADRAERSELISAGYSQVQGIGFYAPTQPAPCLAPVHTYVDDDGARRLAATEAERAELATGGWSDQSGWC